MAGARPAEIQLDITKRKAIDDNLFSVELEAIKENSFNIHQKGDRLVFLNERESTGQADGARKKRQTV